MSTNTPKQVQLLHRAVSEDERTGVAGKKEPEGHEEYVERDKREETTKGKAAPAEEAQRRRREPGKPCKEQLEIKQPACRKAD